MYWIGRVYFGIYLAYVISITVSQNIWVVIPFCIQQIALELYQIYSLVHNVYGFKSVQFRKTWLVMKDIVLGLDHWNLLDYTRIVLQIGYIFAERHVPTCHGCIDCNICGQHLQMKSSIFGFLILSSYFNILQYLRLYGAFRYLIDACVKCFLEVREFVVVLCLMLASFLVYIVFERKLMHEDANFKAVLEHLRGLIFMSFGDFDKAKDLEF